MNLPIDYALIFIFGMLVSYGLIKLQSFTQRSKEQHSVDLTELDQKNGQTSANVFARPMEWRQ